MTTIGGRARSLGVVAAGLLAVPLSAGASPLVNGLPCNEFCRAWMGLPPAGARVSHAGAADRHAKIEAASRPRVARNAGDLRHAEHGTGGTRTAQDATRATPLTNYLDAVRASAHPVLPAGRPAREESSLPGAAAYGRPVSPARGHLPRVAPARATPPADALPAPAPAVAAGADAPGLSASAPAAISAESIPASGIVVRAPPPGRITPKVLPRAGVPGAGPGRVVASVPAAQAVRDPARTKPVAGNRLARAPAAVSVPDPSNTAAAGGTAASGAGAATVHPSPAGQAALRPVPDASPAAVRPEPGKPDALPEVAGRDPAPATPVLPEPWKQPPAPAPTPGGTAAGGTVDRPSPGAEAALERPPATSPADDQGAEQDAPDVQGAALTAQSCAQKPITRQPGYQFCQDADGTWSVYHTDTGVTADIRGVPQTNLALGDALRLAEALNESAQEAPGSVN